MIRSLVFDKDGVILDMAGTWLPVARRVADYTVSRQPDGDQRVTRAELLAAVGVDDVTGVIDQARRLRRQTQAPSAEHATLYQAELARRAVWQPGGLTQIFLRLFLYLKMGRGLNDD